MAQESGYYTDAEQLVDAIVASVGKRIVLALPIGVGKPNSIVNALVHRAVADRGLDVEIFTALTLERPAASGEFERRFLEPAAERLFGNYSTPVYATLMREGRLPANIRITEFYLFPGEWLRIDQAQRAYVSANYTHALEYIIDRGINVAAQLVASRTANDGREFSLSCNPDLSVDLLNARREGRASFIVAAEVNHQLPFMDGDAVLDASETDLALENPDTEFELYSAPRPPISLVDQAIGLHAARLVPDGGTLQIGIGSVGDAVTQGLILRHTNNRAFRDLVGNLTPNGESELFHDAEFEAGLYGLSEMFVNGFLHLADNGILKRSVDGAILHGGFFVETRDFYRRLREMSDEDRSRFQMKPISFINQLYGDEDAKRAARIDARFINETMMATLLGAVVSDGTENGQVVSGVGGQYNFVAQAFALRGARSILSVNATRKSKGKTVSNIRYAYGHQTIPRHLRDIIVTEYGVADLRGKSDEDVITAMLSVTDSRFQEELVEEAKKNGKLSRDYMIPPEFQHNLPARVNETVRPARDLGTLPLFPFGSDYTETEQRLIPALGVLKQASHSAGATARLFFQGLRAGKRTEKYAECLRRMDLGEVSSVWEFAYQKALHGALLESETAGDF